MRLAAERRRADELAALRAAEARHRGQEAGQQRHAADGQRREQARLRADRPVSRVGAAMVLGVWATLIVVVVVLARDLLD